MHVLSFHKSTMSEQKYKKQMYNSSYVCIFLTDGRKNGPIKHGSTSPENLLEV